MYIFEICDKHDIMGEGSLIEHKMEQHMDENIRNWLLHFTQ